MKRFKTIFTEVVFVILGLTLCLRAEATRTCKDAVYLELSSRGFEPNHLFQDYVFDSPNMWDLILSILLMPEGAPVLILGETGTGKEYIARFIHDISSRRERPFVSLDAGILSSELSPSTLFGHAKGAFTGANAHKDGLLTKADRGTFFLDEVLSLPTELQSVFMRALQERTFRKLGSQDLLRSDFRLVSAANKDPADLLGKTFREDLFYRVAQVTLRVPPLRERPEDIPILTRHFLNQFKMEDSDPDIIIDKDALDHLRGYRWPGNIRELQGILVQALTNARKRFAMALLSGEVTPHNIQVEDLPTQIQNSPLVTASNVKDIFRNLTDLPSINEIKLELILEALRRHPKNNRGAAQSLGIGERTVYRQLERLKKSLGRD
jgi:transcriptional regulator with PAS, ATPase and Fis domain